MARQRGDGGRFHTANNNPGGHKNDNGKFFSRFLPKANF